MAQDYLLPPAEISWDGNSPHSRTYDDIYWQAQSSVDDSPLAEKRFVFVDPLLQLVGKPQGNTQVTVGELGFGFGINCLLTAEAWKVMPPACRLDFISIEKHPVDQQSLARILARHELTYASALLAQYPPPFRGQHVIWLADNIRLLLIFEDVEPALANLDARADFWYLDGFAPSKNADMWQPALYKKLFARSRPGATVATYSAAGDVRRGLEQSGFTVSKEKGFGQKRDMLRAKKPGTWEIKRQTNAEVIIIGGGLAGQYCAEALHRRGITNRIIDSGAPGPSHIPQLSVMPQLAIAAETQYRFSLNACQYMQTSPGYEATGVIWRDHGLEQTERRHKIAAQFPNDIIESTTTGEVIYHRSGWLSFETLKQSVAADTRRSKITELHYGGNDCGLWHCHSQEGHVASAAQVILATGFDQLLMPDQLQLRAIRGQAISVETSGITQVINGRVTVFPTERGRSVISGTYARNTSMAIDQGQIKELADLAGELIALDESTAEALVGIRTTTRDRLPVIGESPDWSTLEGTNRVSAGFERQAGLYFCSAFGSRGATHARLCAEHLANKILGEPTALGLAEQQMLSPARFVIRDSTA